MSDDQKKTIYLGIAAAGLALGAYVAYQYWVKSSEPTGMLVELEKAKLTTVKRDKADKLDNQYFLSLLQFVGAETRQRTKDLRKNCQEQRRTHFRSNEWTAYRVIVKKVMEGEDLTA